MNKMNKRGVDILHEKIFTIVLLLFIFGVLFYFVNQQATGQLLEKQSLAKEICLISIASKPDTRITIEHSPDIIIEKKDKGILVNDKEAEVGRGYFYDCYGKFEINSIADGKTEMIIKE
jgi:hypothetical protein